MVPACSERLVLAHALAQIAHAADLELRRKQTILGFDTRLNTYERSDPASIRMTVGHVPLGEGMTRFVIRTAQWLLAKLGPVGMRSDWMMTLALRWMGNLVTDEDRDRAARVWRWAGRRSIARDARPPFV